MNILHLDASILDGGSVSRTLSAAIVARLVQSTPTAHVTYRDLAREALPHVTPATIPSAHPLAAAAGLLEGDRAAMRAASDVVIQEFLDADAIVIGAPMYNFTIPSQLKVWIDRIVVPGLTFRYGASGPEGLASNKRVLVAIAQGGVYEAGTPARAAEHVESYLRTVFGLLGVTQLEFIVAQGLSKGDDSRATALVQAHDAIDRLAV